MTSSPAVVLSGYSLNAATANTISILSSSSFRDDTGAYHIVGEVKNNSPAESMNYVKIVLRYITTLERLSAPILHILT